METLSQAIGLSLLIIVLSYLGIVGIRRWAERHQILDIPNERSSHTRPVPRGGGLVIVVATILGLVWSWLSSPAWPMHTLLAYASGATLIAIVSWFDDVCSLPRLLRFGAHSLAAFIILLGVGCWPIVPLPLLGQSALGWLGCPITFLWVVGLTNAYNFMDGIDGIAGGQAVVAALGWAVLGWQTQLPFVEILGLLLAASSVGFLGHNWPPARIFMGDVGSAFLGYTFAVLGVVAAQHDPRLVVPGVLFVCPFVFDTIFTFLRRLRAGENVFVAHRSHLYQRLIIVGYTHLSVTLLYSGLAILCALLAIVWVMQFASVDVLLLLFIPLSCLALWLFVVRQEHRNIPNYPTRRETVTDSR